MPDDQQKKELKNIFSAFTVPAANEWVETLLQSKNFRLERIVSHGHASDKNFWYDQDHSEWVILLSGGGRLVFADQNEEIELRPGDYLNIPAHRKHRVVWTEPDQPSIWLTIHYEPLEHNGTSPMENSKTVDYALLHAFMDSLKDPFLFVDTNHIIRYMNKTARNHFKDGANLLNRSLLDCHNKHSRKIIIENLEAFKNGEDERLIHNTEKKRLFMRAVRDGNGQLIGYYERYEPPQPGIRLGEISILKNKESQLSELL